ncbi:MAG: hypothetical protein RMK19_07460 [Bacteroidia bacterium]|nr:hypothetical protein [Bacteroidia bacterium]MDW8015831.1 hypothetical protein [Bacteroidia bacterium]
MDRLRLPSTVKAQIVLILSGLSFAQQPLKKPNTFRLEALSREGEEALRIRYEIPFDGVVEFRLLGKGDSVVYFFQWPSSQGTHERRLPNAKGLRGTFRYRITYKGIDYTGQVSL